MVHSPKASHEIWIFLPENHLNDVFGDRYLCYMSVTSQALKICILPSMEGNMLGIVYWFLCSLCKGEQIWTDNCTPQKLGANQYALQGNIVFFGSHNTDNSSLIVLIGLGNVCHRVPKRQVMNMPKETFVWLDKLIFPSRKSIWLILAWYIPCLEINGR